MYRINHLTVYNSNLNSRIEFNLISRIEFKFPHLNPVPPMDFGRESQLSLPFFVAIILNSTLHYMGKWSRGEWNNDGK